jgi:two-component system, cell cycle sensor histidine kinase and response regulator CckA
MIPEQVSYKSDYKEKETLLLYWQEKIFNWLFFLLVVIGVLPFLLSCRYALVNGEWSRILFYSSMYLWAAGVLFLKKIPFDKRGWAGVFWFYALGLFSLGADGFVGSSRIYFFCFASFGAVFFGVCGGGITMFLAMATLVLAGILNFQWTPVLGFIKGISSPMAYTVVVGTFFVLCSAITFSLAILINALEMSGRKFRLLVNHTPDVLWTLDARLNVSYMNDAIFPLAGFLPRQLLGGPFTRLLPREKILEFEDLIQEDKPFLLETDIRHLNGEMLNVEIRGDRIKGYLGRKTSYNGVLRDVTREKHGKKEQATLKMKLVQAEKLKNLGILAGGVAHDLNNILSGIATYPEVLLMDEGLTPQIRQGLTIIKDSGRKASSVVSDLLTISRGAANTEMEVLNINTVIERYLGSADFARIKASYQQVHIEVVMEPELLNINGSYIHIEKAVMNLVINGVEETAQKETGHVTISTANLYVDTLAGTSNLPAGEYVMLGVSDNGSGIPDEYHKKIFDPFFTKKEMGKSGTGLGLTVVRNTVRDHQGDVRVFSCETGTRFELFFPAIRKELPQKKRSNSLVEITGQGQRILIVDDLDDQRKIAGSILKNLGYQVFTVADGMDAVAFVKENPVDLIILDMVMEPSISGFETYQRIKKINPGQKAIIASGHSESKEVLMTQDLGAGAFVKKPYTIMDMGIAVKEELEKQELEKREV